MDVTKKIAKYIDDNGIKLSVLANRTSIPAQALYDSLGKNGTRKLKADELLRICDVLKLNPMDFRPAN